MIETSSSCSTFYRIILPRSTNTVITYQLPHALCHFLYQVCTRNNSINNNTWFNFNAVQIKTSMISEYIKLVKIRASKLTANKLSIQGSSSWKKKNLNRISSRLLGLSRKWTLPLQGAITSSFLSRWSLWHLTWQRRHSRAGGGLKTCHRGLEQASQFEGKWYSVGMNSWPLCGRQLVFSPWGTVSMSASFLHSPSLAYRIWIQTERHINTALQQNMPLWEREEVDILTSVVQANLEYPWNLLCLSSVYVSLCDWPHVKQFATQESRVLRTEF